MYVSQSEHELMCGQLSECINPVLVLLLLELIQSYTAIKVHCNIMKKYLFHKSLARNTFKTFNELPPDGWFVPGCKAASLSPSPAKASSSLSLARGWLGTVIS